MRHRSSPRRSQSNAGQPAPRTATAALLIVTAMALPGCYTKVVDARGPAADSQKARQSYEKGSERPLTDALSRETKVERKTQPLSPK